MATSQPIPLPTASSASVVFVGAGPAGLAPLVKAACDGTLARLAAGGLVIVDRASEFGAGALAEHAIGSDTLADTFLECLAGGAEPRLLALEAHEASRQLARYRGGSAPLAVVSAFLQVLGRTMRDILLSHGARIFAGHAAIESRRSSDGAWRTRITGPDGENRTIVSDRLVLATGAEQNIAQIANQAIGGRSLLPSLAGKIMLSGEVLAHAGAERIRQRLDHVAQPKVAILGGSHSALACANLLLSGNTGIGFGSNAVSLLHRRKLRIFYPTAQAAVADGYTDFTDDDICPLTRRLFRLAGFRLEARALVSQVLGIGGGSPETRLRVLRLGDDAAPASGSANTEAWRILGEADLVIPAFGYRPRALRLLDTRGEVIALAAQLRPNAPLVDSQCRVLDQQQQPIPRVWALGLAAGFVPSGAMGGEPSFRGQTNGLWLWQNDIGAMVVQSLLEKERGDVAA